MPRPDLRVRRARTGTSRLRDLHYADTPEFATGHGVSADWDLVDGECRQLRTRWIPRPRSSRRSRPTSAGVELRMEALGALADGAAAQAALAPLVSQYRALDRIGANRDAPDALTGERRETAEAAARRGVRSRPSRIERGIATARRRSRCARCVPGRQPRGRRGAASASRRDVEEPAWRPFQLAFLLINLPGLADPAAPDREIVDLLYFPTGGGKTEAYLGLAAFAIVLRRLRRRTDGAAGGRGRDGRDALHAAAADARPALPRRRPDLRARARA